MPGFGTLDQENFTVPGVGHRIEGCDLNFLSVRRLPANDLFQWRFQRSGSQDPDTYWSWCGTRRPVHESGKIVDECGFDTYLDLGIAAKTDTRVATRTRAMVRLGLARSLVWVTLFTESSVGRAAVQNCQVLFK